MVATVTGTGRTPNGTDWTTFMEAVPGAGTVRWGCPTSLIGSTDVPLMLYTHGAGGSSNQFESTAAFSGIRNYLLDSGCAWVEGSGGGTQPWANPESQTAYEIAWQHAADIFEPSISFGLFRSMGGLVGQWLLTKSTVVNMVGAMVNSGVQDLMWAYTFGRWTAAMNEAWGVSSYSEFHAAAAPADPMQFNPSEWSGTKMMQLIGTEDDLVIPGENGLAMRARYAGQPAVDLLDIRVGGDHSAANGSYLQTAAMSAYVDLVLGKEHTYTPFREIVSRARLTGDGWRLIIGSDAT